MSRLVEDQLRRPVRAHRGLLLCTNDRVVRYALASSSQPTGIASYDLLPPEERAALPSEADPEPPSRRALIRRHPRAAARRARDARLGTMLPLRERLRGDCWVVTSASGAMEANSDSPGPRLRCGQRSAPRSLRRLLDPQDHRCLRTSRSIRSSATSARSRLSSSTSSFDSPSVPSPASRARATQLPSVPSFTPRSRATCAIGFPVSSTIRTAPSRNSRSYFFRFSGISILIVDASTVRGEPHADRKG